MYLKPENFKGDSTLSPALRKFRLQHGVEKNLLWVEFYFSSEQKKGEREETIHVERNPILVAPRRRSIGVGV
jgi:hypothetical protein